MGSISNERMARLLGPLALGWLVSIAIGFFALSRDEPGQNAPASQVVSFYQAHGTRETASIFVIGIGLGLFAFYLSGLRMMLRQTSESHSWLAGAAYIGGVILLAAFGAAGLERMALILAARNNRPTLASDLNFTAQIVPVPMFLGVAVLGLATGLCLLTAATVPRWIGIVGIVIGVVACLGPVGFISFLATPIYMTIVGFYIGAQVSAHEGAAAGEARRTMGHRLTLRHH